MNKKLYYGAAYYPELWDEAVWSQDLEFMKEAGINVVRMAEFAWSTLEPHQDHFQVEFFKDIITRLYREGIETIICTPTPTPPVWISHNHPERMLVDENNICMVHGGRQQVCSNNAFLRERSSIIIEKMARVYGALPGVIGWQLDNEWKGNVSECYCETCKHLWHQWLEKKYGTIDRLNSAWSTHVWSQYYEAFEQVPQPLKTPAAHNPSLLSAYRQFSRDQVTEFAKEQVSVIRKHSVLPITHNSSPYHYIDNQKIFESLDFASFDYYCTSAGYYQILACMDTYKSLKSGKPFWVMETSPCFSGCSSGYQTVHKNGFLKAEAAAAYALGAGGFCYWLWRQHRSGMEQTHGSVLNSWGMPSVGFKNVAEVGQLKEKLEKAFVKSEPAKAELAVTYSDRARAFFLSEPLESGCSNYVDVMQKWYDMLLDTGIHRDFLYEDGSLEGYKVLMTPFLPYVSDEYISRAVRFVEEGGIWIAGPLTGIRTGEHTINTDHALGKLEELAGVKTLFHYPMTGTGAIGNAFGVQAPLALWSSVFECKGAIAVGMTEDGVTPGIPFITEYRKGKGKIVMLGSMPSGGQGVEMLRKLVAHYAGEAGITIATDVQPGTLVVPRRGKDFIQWVIINMDGKGGAVTVPVPFKDAFTGGLEEAGRVSIGPYDCRVIEF
jgi:beta-galactosidase